MNGSHHLIGNILLVKYLVFIGLDEFDQCTRLFMRPVANVIRRRLNLSQWICLVQDLLSILHREQKSPHFSFTSVESGDSNYLSMRTCWHALGVTNKNNTSYRRALLEVKSIANLWVYLVVDQCCFLWLECDVSLRSLYWWFLRLTVCLLQSGIPGNLHTFAMII